MESKHTLDMNTLITKAYNDGVVSGILKDKADHCMDSETKRDYLERVSHYQEEFKKTCKEACNNYERVCAELEEVIELDNNRALVLQETEKKLEAAKELLCMKESKQEVYTETIVSNESLRAQNAALVGTLENMRDKLEHEATGLGAVDGYDYRSGKECGLRMALLDLDKIISEAAKQKEGV
jgi:hypothetical protein